MKPLHVGSLTVGAVALVALVVAVRSQSGGSDEQKSGLDQAPACIGDKSCVVHRVDDVSALAKGKRTDAYFVARAMHVALDHDDCDAATELAGGLERVDVNRATDKELADAVDRALLGRTGYCAVAARKPIEAPTPGSTVRLERGMCEGECPAYAVTITSEGEVTFEGAVYTGKKGTAKARIAAPRARELFDAFERMSFDKLPPHLGEGIVDYATATLTLKRGTTTITVADGASCFANDSIDRGACYLESLTDEIAETDKWVRMPARDK